MKNTWPRILTVVFTVLAAHSADAQEAAPIERVTVKDNLTVAVQGATTAPVKEKLEWPDGLIVSTNATYTVGEGKARTIKDGQTLRRDGTVLNADGTTQPVFDHLAMVQGRALIMRDGEQSAVAGVHTLPDGTRVTAEGSISRPGKPGRRLLDGEILRLDGKTVEAKDTISLINGKVTVQKDGSSFSVAPGRTLVMNDGTKVFGEGHFIKRDGTRVTLTDGQTVEIEGVIRR